jgi:hypothetical protein
MVVRSQPWRSTLARCQNGNRQHYLLKSKNIVPSEIKPCSFSLYSQAQKTCDYYYHDHHTDDVKDVHCVLLRVRDAMFLSWVSKRCWSNHALIDQRKSV